MNLILNAESLIRNVGYRPDTWKNSASVPQST